MTMTNDLLIPLTDIGLLLILLLAASFTTGTIVFLIEALGRISLRTTAADGSPRIGSSTKVSAGLAPIANTP